MRKRIFKQISSTACSSMISLKTFSFRNSVETFDIFLHESICDYFWRKWNRKTYASMTHEKPTKFKSLNSLSIEFFRTFFNIISRKYFKRDYQTKILQSNILMIFCVHLNILFEMKQKENFEKRFVHTLRHLKLYKTI